MSQIDLLLLHPPSVYDFRRHAILYGPVSDLIPSSPVFEMYPLGFLTITSYLEARGLHVRVVNLALRMINDRRFDVRAFLVRLAPKAVGIDLHWLPHAHGAIEVARLVKQVHPQTPVIFGGLSATYFHAELIREPAVDCVLRGDCTEPPLYDLLMCLAAGQKPEHVPNLTWKDGETVRVNPFTFLPTTLDYVDLEPQRMVRMVLRYRDLQSVLPFNGWWQNPITAIFTVKGCAHECVTCGGARGACALLSHRSQPLFRSPANLVKNILDISRIAKGPIFLVGDLLQAGAAYADAVLRLLAAARIKNELVFEFFDLPPLSLLHAIDRAVANWSLELSPESHDEAVRSRQDHTSIFTNAQMEEVIETALHLRCHRLDIFFLIGLPGQTPQSVMETVHYCEHLFQLADRRLSCFISPLGPFLDPGSAGFEEPERLGYRLFARTLAEHRRLLVQPSWQRILNYETRWMTREQLLAATYDAGEALNRLKLRYGRIDRTPGETVARRIAQARTLKARLDRLPADATAQQKHLRGEIYAFSVSTVCDKRELFWRRHLVNFRTLAILRIALAWLREQMRGLSSGKDA
jgi:B12-binding domain/radical SAM domain protein